MTVEKIVNLPVFVTVLCEHVPQEHQLRMQAVFVPKSSSPDHHCGKCSFFVGSVLMGPSVEVDIRMGGYVVHPVAQRVVGSPVDIYVQEGMMALLIGLHGELKALMDAV
jgi:hypothetical protein